MDVVVSTWIAAPPADVARTMFDPFNDPFWIGGASSSERVTPGPLAVGSRVRRLGGLPFIVMAWTTEVTDLEPGRRLDMRFVEGPITGIVTYQIDPDGDGSHVTVRNHARARFELPGIGLVVRLGVAADLRRLKRLLEG